MALLNRNFELHETSIEDGAGEAGGITVVPLSEWDPKSGNGLLLEVTDEPDEQFISAPLIAINFPAFNDGRGLSLAVLLRTRFNYQGELRAVGEVHPDVIHYMKRCGFDTFLMPEGRKMPPLGKGPGSTLAPYSDYYQASVLEPEPAYRRIRRGA